MAESDDSRGRPEPAGERSAAGWRDGDDSISGDASGALGADDELLRSRERLQTLSRRLIGAQEMERQRVARELHDDIGQTLSAVKMNLQSIRRAAGASGVADRIQESIDSVDQALRRVRDLSVALRPLMLDDLGLVPALRWFVDRQSQRAGYRCRFDADESVEPPPEVQIACFRIAQEALTNVARHAGAHNVDLGLRRRDDVLELTVTDDGRGFDVKMAVERLGADASLGLLGMRERARLLGGRVTIESTRRGGTTVTARLPLTGTEGS